MKEQVQQQALHTFGFAATEAAQKFIQGVTLALSRATEAGLVSAPSQAPAAKFGIIRD